MAGKKKQSKIESNLFVDDFLGWMDSPDGETAIDVMDELFPILETLELDAKMRQIIWPDSQRLSIDESVQRIHANRPELSVNRIEENVIFWIEGDYAPEHYSQKQLDELDRLTEKWIGDHSRHRQPK
jgi:hypothetical protein